VQSKAADKWTNQVLPGGSPTAAALPAGTDYVSIYAVDRYGTAGPTAAVTPAAAVARR
jgi:hypothetical protein